MSLPEEGYYTDISPPKDTEVRVIQRKQLLRDVENMLKKRIKMNDTHILLKQIRTYLKGE